VVEGRFERVVYYCTAEVLPFVGRAVDRARAVNQVMVELLSEKDLAAISTGVSAPRAQGLHSATPWLSTLFFQQVFAKTPLRGQGLGKNCLPDKFCSHALLFQVRGHARRGLDSLYAAIFTAVAADTVEPMSRGGGKARGRGRRPGRACDQAGEDKVDPFCSSHFEHGEYVPLRFIYLHFYCHWLGVAHWSGRRVAVAREGVRCREWHDESPSQP
jgi:hypothetical protein